ncbi:MAG TPA: undecaprenyl-diphosphate phosphatase, partial [Actinobacteria bacterium]|nr:undecaprenyl-diphosphate phosphatase [Actinomycetota bacterium]
ATTAVLHLGTLVAVLAYYRTDLNWMLTSLRTDRLARRLVTLLAIGTVPAMVVGLGFSDQVERLQESTTAVGLGLIFTAAILAIGERFTVGTVKAERAKPLDALLIGLAQAVALIPGVSRSGMTISTGAGLGLSRHESARFAFLLSIPVIFGSGLLEMVEARSQGDLAAELLIGITIAAIVGYGAIIFLIRGLTRWGMKPFAWYCLAAGLLTVAFL